MWTRFRDKFFNGEIALGFLFSVLFWIPVLGWQAAYAPTEREKNECYETAKKSGHKSEECKSLWERTTSDPVAFFTLWLAIFTFVLGVSTVLLWRATKTAAASQIEDTRAIQRAYVKMSHAPPGLIQQATTVFVMKAHIGNYGQTPALVTDTVVNWEVFKKGKIPSAPIYQFDELTSNRAFLVSSNDFFTFDVPIILSPQQATDLIDGASLYVFGYVDYIDKFKTKHRAGYGRVYVGPGGGVVPPAFPSTGTLAIIASEAYNYDRPA